MIKAIVFDFFGVLSNINLWHEYLSTLRDKKEIDQVKELNRQCDAGLITRDEFFSQVEAITGKPLQDVESLKRSQSIKNEPLFDYIKKLKNSYKIGILSNIGSNWIRDEFMSSQDKKLFDATTMSFEVGATKPNELIYKDICKKLSVEPHEVVFVDDIKEYCEAAQELGMQEVHYRNFPQMKHDLEAILNHQ